MLLVVQLLPKLMSKNAVSLMLFITGWSPLAIDRSFCTLRILPKKGETKHHQKDPSRARSCSYTSMKVILLLVLLFASASAVVGRSHLKTNLHAYYVYCNTSVYGIWVKLFNKQYLFYIMHHSHSIFSWY